MEAVRHLKSLPQRVYPALSPNRISFDFVIVSSRRTYYIEYHERQHASLSVNRPTKVFDADGSAHTVPRYVQRLIRDVWRIQTFSDVTVVWDDWFARTGRKPPQLARGFHEFSLPGRFTFGGLHLV
jgi:hypothetical protein